MNVRKSLAVAGVMAAAGLTSFGALGIASAQTDSSGSDSLIDKLASRFNLNKSEVQAVFDEEKAARQAEHKADMSDRLQGLVDDGKITAEQKTLIENKIGEVRAAMEAERSSLETWADQNGIDLKYLKAGMHGNGDRLQKLVDNGKITADQKSKIEQKLEELETKRDAARDALEAWADEHDIDEKYLMFGKVVRGGHGRGPGGF
jgi:hypothetical protein